MMTDFCYASPNVGSMRISWEALMELPLADFIVMAKRVQELQEREAKASRGSGR